MDLIFATEKLRQEYPQRVGSLSLENVLNEAKLALTTYTLGSFWNWLESRGANPGGCVRQARSEAAGRVLLPCNPRVAQTCVVGMSALKKSGASEQVFR